MKEPEYLKVLFNPVSRVEENHQGLECLIRHDAQLATALIVMLSRAARPVDGILTDGPLVVVSSIRAFMRTSTGEHQQKLDARCRVAGYYQLHARGGGAGGRRFGSRGRINEPTSKDEAEGRSTYHFLVSAHTHMYVPQHGHSFYVVDSHLRHYHDGHGINTPSSSLYTPPTIVRVRVRVRFGRKQFDSETRLARHAGLWSLLAGMLNHSTLFIGYRSEVRMYYNLTCVSHRAFSSIKR